MATWLHSHRDSPLLTFTLHQILHSPGGTIKEWASLAGHLAFQLTNQLMAGNQGVLVGPTLSLVRCHGSRRHPFFFNMHQPNRSILQEAGQGRQLFNVFYMHIGYTKGTPVPFWIPILI